MLSCAWRHYDKYDFESVRVTTPMGSQFYIMEFEQLDENYEDGALHLEWNVYQCVVDDNSDESIYTICEDIVTGLRPLETYHNAMQALDAICGFLKDCYEWDPEYTGPIYHHIYAGWADERRRSVYSKVLRKRGWTLASYDGEPAYELTIIEEAHR